MQQLHMVHPDPGSAGQARAPEGFVLRAYREGDEQAWADVINTTDMGGDYDVTKVRQFLTAEKLFDPEGLFFACDGESGKSLATACAWWTLKFGRPRPTLHMVAARPEARGKGLGKLVCQAVLNYFAGRGQREVILSTDDHRLAAIATYFRLGWLPMRFVRGEDHAARWQAVLEKLSGKCGCADGVAEAKERAGVPRYAGAGRCVTIGVFGLLRGAGIAALAHAHPAGRVVAGCDQAEEARRRFADRFGLSEVESRYEALLDSPAEAIIVANDCPDHAPAAIAALRAGKDVLSEVTAFHTPAEGVELVEAVEETQRAYMLAENCLYSNAMMELAHQTLIGALGGMQYAEGDYVHDIRSLMRPDGGRHWRAWLPPLFYCTHPLGPILRAGRERPVRVVAMHTGRRMEGTQGGIDMGSMLIQCSGGSAVRIACGFAVNREPSSLWVCFYGTRASLETDRWKDEVHLYDARCKHAASATSYRPTGRDGRSYTGGGHFGADGRMMEYWIESLADGLVMPEDVYEGADMTMPGILAHRSSLSGSAPIDVPDLRNRSDRDACRGDRARPDPADATRLIDA